MPSKKRPSAKRAKPTSLTRALAHEHQFRARREEGLENLRQLEAREAEKGSPDEEPSLDALNEPKLPTLPFMPVRNSES